MKTQLVLSEVLSALDSLRAECAPDGRTVTAAELATKLGLKRPTLYAQFPEAVDAIAKLRAAEGSSARAGRPRDERARLAEDRLRTVRRERDDLAAELGVYAEQVRQLTIENLKLRDALEARAGVSRITRDSKKP